MINIMQQTHVLRASKIILITKYIIIPMPDIIPNQTTIINYIDHGISGIRLILENIKSIFEGHHFFHIDLFVQCFSCFLGSG